MQPFEITSEPTVSGRGSRIAVRGELDAYRGMELGEVLEEHLEAGRSPIELEASGVSFVDSGGLRILVEFDDRLRASGDALRLTDPSPQLLHLLRFAGLHERFVDAKGNGRAQPPTSTSNDHPPSPSS